MGCLDIVLWLALAATGIVSFVWRELHAEAPLMNLRYFRSIPFVRSMLSLVLATLAFYPVAIFGPIYLLNVIGTAPLAAGLSDGDAASLHDIALSSKRPAGGSI